MDSDNESAEEVANGSFPSQDGPPSAVDAGISASSAAAPPAAGTDPASLRLNLAWLETWDPNADTEDPATSAPVPETEMPWNAMMEAWSSGFGDNTGITGTKRTSPRKVRDKMSIYLCLYVFMLPHILFSHTFLLFSSSPPPPPQRNSARPW